MSDLLTAAAAAMGLPESLVQRSAEARAAEIGASADDVLTEWSGGEAASPTGEVGVSDETPASASPEITDEPEPTSAPEPIIAVPEQPAAMSEPVPDGPYVPPVLVDADDRPGVVLTAVLGLFLVVLLVGLVGPSIPTDDPGARTSEIALSGSAEDGQHVYASLGCAACHTQMVRPVVADVGLGPVTLNDTNQVLGTRRFGPDLSDVGSRLSASELEAAVEGAGDHPEHQLSSDDMGNLVAYLSESSYGGGS